MTCFVFAIISFLFTHLSNYKRDFHVSKVFFEFVDLIGMAYQHLGLLLRSYKFLQLLVIIIITRGAFASKYINNAG